MGTWAQVLTRPDKLPRGDFAAWGSLPEAEVAGRRLALAQRVLDEHSPQDLLAFLFRHGHAADAVALMYPPVPAGDVEQSASGLDAPAPDVNGADDPVPFVGDVPASASAGPRTPADADNAEPDWHPVTDRFEPQTCEYVRATFLSIFCFAFPPLLPGGWGSS